MDPSKNIIDISTDNVTTAIRLPDDVPRLLSATLFISDGVMHMLPGYSEHYQIADADGNIVNTSITYQINWRKNIWNFDLKSQKWDVQVSGIKDQAQDVNVAFDVENQVGWYYGGAGNSMITRYGQASADLTEYFQDLYRLDRGESIPKKVETNSTVGRASEGELVFIAGVGEAGILVLIGGVSMAMGVVSSIVDQTNVWCSLFD